MWTGHALALRAALGDEWVLRGSGLKLKLLRRRGPWLCDVVLADRVSNAECARVHVVVVDLLDGIDHLTLGHGVMYEALPFDAPQQRRRILQHVLGPGRYEIARYGDAEQWGRRQISIARKGDEWQRRHALDLIFAAPWEMVLDVAGPRIVDTLEAETRRLVDLDDAEERGLFLPLVQELARIGRLGPDEQRAALYARAEEKLVDLGLDTAEEKNVRGPKNPPEYLPPTSWPELVGDLRSALSRLHHGESIQLNRLLPGGACARITQVGIGDYELVYDGRPQPLSRPADVIHRVIELFRQDGVRRTEELGYHDDDRVTLPLQRFGDGPLGPDGRPTMTWRRH